MTSKGFIYFLLLLPLLMASRSFSQKPEPVDLVYPLLDAANSRWFYFSSASRPLGMVSLFPDNDMEGTWASGYRYKEDTIRGFSHIHGWQLSGVSVLPVAFRKSAMVEVFRNPGSFFSHETEDVSPGYHSLILERYKINVELTASNRVGFHKYEFRNNKGNSGKRTKEDEGNLQQGVIFRLTGPLGPAPILSGGFKQVNDFEIRGYNLMGKTGRRPKPYKVFFAATFDKPIEDIFLFRNGKIEGHMKKWDGEDGDLLVVFKDLSEGVGEGEVVTEVLSESSDKIFELLLMKVGISFTSEEAATANIKAEVPHWNFKKTKQEARDQWNSMLSRVQVEGGTLKQQQRFYTDLWRSIQGRRQISDVDGKYPDYTGKEFKIRQVPVGDSGNPEFHMYNSDAFWGAQWTLNTLWSLVYPELVEDFMRSFLEFYRNGGLIPRGPSGGNYTYVMTGAQLTPFYTSAWQKGIRDFNIEEAYEALRKNHFPGGMMSKVGYEHHTWKGGGIEAYIEMGYVPYPFSDTLYGGHQEGAGLTLEYAYQDWCLAQLAKALGKEEDHSYFLKRSQNYRNLFHSESGYMVPRDWEGHWRSSFDPLEYQHGFVEGNAAHFTWFVPHDLQELFLLMGGKSKAVDRLNKQFELAEPFRFSDQHPEKEKIFFNDSRMWINYSNQPNMQAAFIFNHAGAPWLTQYWSRKVVEKAYSELSPYYGYNGDEDQGLMGSLNVLMKLGLFQMSGGTEEDPRYELGSPIFEKVSIDLDPEYYDAQNLTIIAKNTSSENIYIQAAELNGRPLKKYYFHHSDINLGATLILEMGKYPNMNWGLED